ncbi:MAG: hypothetical protein ACI86M_003812 [Saprospiraceae bacterium]|jgi:uncharacterized protein (TIGR02145 family)
MKNLKEVKRMLVLSFLLLTSTAFNTSQLSAQQVEVQGELKVTQMTADNTQENLVIHNADGTLGSRSVASLPPPPPPIDTTRNLASDYELANQLCNCPNLPPFMIQKLLESGYTQEDLVGAGVNVQDVIDAQRMGILIDSRDNKSYKTVTIGTQTWMAENLNFGTMINSTTSTDNQTDNDIIEKYCYSNDGANCTTYGGLYQWDEMMQYVTTEGTQGVCPTGWHLPTDTEWKTLEMELGMTQSQADGTGNRGTDQSSQLAGNEPLWTNGNLDQNGAFGSSGFTALPGGYRSTSGSFFTQSNYAYFWSSSESGGTAWYRTLGYNNPKVYRFDYSKLYGFSVRCVQD